MPGACFAGSHSPRPPPLAPPAPQRIAPPCSSASQLLWRSRLPMSVHHRLRLLAFPMRASRQRAGGRTWGLPVPAQRASAHARVSDHAGPSGRSRYRAHPCCLPSAERRRRPGRGYFRGSMAGLCAPLSTLRRCPRGQLRMTRGRCGSLLLHRDGLAPSTPCRSPGALCFTPDSDRKADEPNWSLSAKSCHMHRSKWLRYSITSSAVASNAGGTVRPSAFAALRLITISNLVGSWTGSSLGFSPLSIRSA